MFNKQSLSLVLLALVISLASAYLAYSGKTENLDWLHFDAIQTLSHLPPSDDLVIVDIDDKSLNQLGRWPWSRNTHAALIQTLTQAGAKAVVFDVLFPELDLNDPESDQHFAQAIQQNGRVILPLYFETLGQQGLIVETPPHQLFYQYVNAIGHVHLETENDGIVRSVFLKSGVGEAYWPHLALALLQQLQDQAPATQTPKTTLIPGRRAQIAADSVPTMNIIRDFHNLIPMPAATQGLRHYSYSDILDGSVEVQNLKDKLIFIGATASGLGDLLTTPIGSMFGVELNAWIFHALRHNLLISDTDRLAFAIGTFCLVLLLVLLLGRLSPRLFLVFSILGVSGIFASSSLLLLLGKVWIPPASAIIGLLLFFPLWSWLRAESILRYLRTEIAKLNLLAEDASAQSNKKHLAEEFLSQTGLFDVTQHSPTRKGIEVAQALSFRDEAKLDVSHFWQAQLQQYDENSAFVSRHPEGIELVSRTISKLSALKRNDQKNRQLIEQSLSSLQDAVCIADICGTISFANKRFQEWFQVAPETEAHTTGKQAGLLPVLQGICLKSELSWPQVFSALYQDETLFSDEATLSSKAVSKIAPQNSTIFAEQEKHFLCQVSLVSLNAHYRDTFIFTFTDISNLKAAENARAEALSFLSHDLRSPMVSVLAILEKSQFNKTDTQPALKAEDVQSIESLVRKNLEYAESFLQLSKADALLETSLAPLDLHGVLDAAQVHANALARPKSIQVSTQRCDQDAWVLGDLGLLERALNNLISNAIKFSPNKSTLCLSLDKNNHELSLSVRDQGPGIAPEDRSGLFERFTRLNKTESSHGAGLGLNFVATVIKKHQGHISLESELGQGSSFTLHLPALNEQSLFMEE